MIRFVFPIALLVALALGVRPDPVSSQASSSADAAPVSERLGPAVPDARLLPARARAVRPQASDVIVSELPQERDRSGIPYMVAGGALFVAGAIAGDTAGALMMVGGGVAGAYGLFVYFGGDVEERLR